MPGERGAAPVISHAAGTFRKGIILKSCCPANVVTPPKHRGNACGFNREQATGAAAMSGFLAIGEVTPTTEPAMPMASLTIVTVTSIAGGENATAPQDTSIAARGRPDQRRGRSDMGWTTNSVERLKKLWADGDTARQIAIELGITRNSVIGKVHRLGLPGRPKQRRSIRIARPAIRGKPEPELIENLIPTGQRCSTLELSEGKCRWPIGDPSAPDFFFCGGKTIEGLPYCGYHARIAYQPVVDRRDNNRTALEQALAHAAE